MRQDDYDVELAQERAMPQAQTKQKVGQSCQETEIKHFSDPVISVTMLRKILARMILGSYEGRSHFYD